MIGWKIFQISPQHPGTLGDGVPVTLGNTLRGPSGSNRGRATLRMGCGLVRNREAAACSHGPVQRRCGSTPGTESFKNFRFGTFARSRT